MDSNQTINSSTSSSNTGTPGMGEQLSRTNLYIRGLPPHTTDKDLLQMCGSYGNIISTKAILDKNTNKCKGYGFVDFESPYAAEAAVKALQAQGIQAQMAKVGTLFPLSSPALHSISCHPHPSCLFPNDWRVTERLLYDNHAIRFSHDLVTSDDVDASERVGLDHTLL